MLNLGSNSNNSSSRIGTVEENIRVRKGLNLLKIRCCSSWGKKRILNMHEKRFYEFENFQANITVFQTNTNASLRNCETQVGKLALSLQNQSRNAFCKTRENSNFLKTGKMVILVKIQNFSRSWMMKQTSPFESYREI